LRFKGHLNPLIFNYNNNDDDDDDDDNNNNNNNTSMLLLLVKFYHSMVNKVLCVFSDVPGRQTHLTVS